MKFKVGDWVSHEYGKNKIIEISLDSQGSTEFRTETKGIIKAYRCKLWSPKSNEWCWYGFELVQVIDSQQDYIKICRQKSDSYEEISIECLEPFTGRLPTITDNKN